MTDTDVIVIGGGVAGLAAAAQVARLGLRCTAFTGPQPGGHLLSINAIQDMPGHPDGVPGYDLCPTMQEDAMDAGVECLADDAPAPQADGDAWVVGNARAPCVILAPGSRLRSLGVPGEDRFAGKGVSHCASCDGPMLGGRPVAVVGGGDAACQEALTLTDFASGIHLLVRGPALRARPAWQHRIEATPLVKLHLESRVAEILGDAAVNAVRLHDGTTLAVDAVFVFAGLVPDTSFVRELVPLDESGHIVVDTALRTPRRGLFAAGIARSGTSGQAAAAIEDGIAAAHSAHHYLGQRDWPSS